MRPHIKVITLAVGDLGRSLSFYRDGLKLPTQGIDGHLWEIAWNPAWQVND